MDTRVVEVGLPNGATALVRALDVEGGGATKTALADKFNFDQITATLEGLSLSIKAALATAAPNKVTVELGLEVALKAGKLTALLVEGAGKGSLAVTLEWNGGAGASG